MSLEEKIDKNHLPQHVAIIMDGNGRWAKARGLERYMGHQEGVVSVRKVVEAASDLGIKYLTMYNVLDRELESANRRGACFDDIDGSCYQA